MSKLTDVGPSFNSSNKNIGQNLKRRLCQAAARTEAGRHIGGPHLTQAPAPRPNTVSDAIWMTCRGHVSKCMDGLSHHGSAMGTSTGMCASFSPSDASPRLPAR